MNYIKSVVFGIAIIGGFIMYMGFNVKSYNVYLIIIGTIILLTGLIPYLVLLRKEEINGNKLYKDWKDKLVKDGLKILVDLSKVKIKSNSYSQEVERVPTKYEGLDELAGIDRRIFTNINECVIVYDIDIKGKRLKFTSDIIHKDKVTLEFLLLDKKTTELYIDKSDYENYFFDFEFLK